MNNLSQDGSQRLESRCKRLEDPMRGANMEVRRIWNELGSFGNFPDTGRSFPDGQQCTVYKKAFEK